jgi:ribosomal protein L29
MKTNDKKDLHKKSVEELGKILGDNRRELTESRLSHSRGKLKNPRTIRSLRKTIAQIASVLRGKELANE